MTILYNIDKPYFPGVREVREMSVSDRFQTLRDRVQRLGTEVDALDKHIATTTRRLKTVYPDAKVELIGSHARGSAIHGGDADLMVSLPRSEIVWGGSFKSSTTVLGNVRTALQDRYTQTEIGRDGQAVVLSFSGGRSIDVVPAAFEGMVAAGPGGANRPLFRIPDGEGGWMKTSPRAHGEFIAAADQRSAGKLKFVAQMLKFWRATRTPNVPVNSFHVELLLAHDGTCAGARSYAECMREALALLNKRGCAALQDPLGISGWIRASSTDAKRTSASRSVADSATHATQALAAERDGSLAEAYRQWNIVFNDEFPAK